MNYTVIVEDTVERLCASVNILLMTGSWRVQGGVVAIVEGAYVGERGISTVRYGQAMVREDEELRVRE